MLNAEASAPERVSQTVSIRIIKTVPTDVWFSATLKAAPEVNTGELSLTFVTVTIISWVDELVPSLAVTVAECDDFVS